ncbi:MAG: ArsR family transcriptional regulator [Candidatus Bathycorpusculaceae bacterium]
MHGFKALADIIRLGILKLLSIREFCVCEVMIALNLTQPTASPHLKILKIRACKKEK